MVSGPTAARERPFGPTLARLRGAGLRPTRQRLALGRLLFDGGDRHVTAEQLHREARNAGVKVSLATIYNTLNQFRAAGLLREVVVEPGRSCFDTNVNHHHHFYHEDDGTLADIPASGVTLAAVPAAPAGTRIASVDVVVRVRSDD